MSNEDRILAELRKQTAVLEEIQLSLRVLIANIQLINQQQGSSQE